MRRSRGKRSVPTLQDASGVWGMNEAYEARLDDIWPVLDITKTDLVLYLNAKKDYGTTWLNQVSGPNGSASNVTFNGSNASFNGTSSVVTINGSGLNFSTEQTVMLVLKPTEADSNRRNPYNQAYGGYGTITHEIAGVFSYYHGTNGGDGSNYQGHGSDFTVAQNELACIVHTRTQSTLSWYKNGTLDNSVSNTYPTAASSVNNILIGNGYTNEFLGEINLVALYDRALTATEIQNSYNNIKTDFGLP